MKGKDVALGVVGSGYIATNVHLPVMNGLEGVKLAAICDVDENRARSTALRYRIPRVYTSLTDMLERESLDAVDILTPPDTHVNLAVQALKSNCHCLLEKPLALSVADADRAIEVAKEKHLALHVMHNCSYFPCMRKVRHMISSGVLGEVVGVDIKYVMPIEMERYFDPSHWVHRLPGGVFSDIAPHLAMLLLDFLQDIDCVKVMTKRTLSYPHIPADELKVMVDARNGLGSFTLSFNSPAFRFVIDIVCTKASFYIDADTNTVVIYRAMRSPSEALNRAAKGLRALREICQRVGELSLNAAHAISRRDAMPESHRYLIREFLRSIQGEGTYPISIEKCREVVSLLETVYASMPGMGALKGFKGKDRLSTEE